VAGFLVIFFPILLMLFILFMQKVEEPLRRVATERDIEDFLDHANQSELDTMVRDGTDSAVRRFRLRHRGNRPKNGRKSE
jgi:hypothetical protein